MAAIWWGESAFELDDAKRWQLGAFELWAQRCAEEWKVAFVRGDNPLDDRMDVAVPASAEPPDDSTSYRFGYKKTRPHLRLVPICADRPVVIRTATPFFVPAGQDVTLFVTTSLWIQIYARDPQTPLVDEPMYRPSDTWFGPSPREGELCYSGRTSGRFHLENLAIRPHRAVTEIRVRNKTSALLPVEKIRLPLPNLSVFASSSGMLWTEVVTLERVNDADLAEIRIGKGSPDAAEDAKRVSPPRIATRERTLARTFGGILGLKGMLNHDRMVE
jgi:hypothetical protein